MLGRVAVLGEPGLVAEGFPAESLPWELHLCGLSWFDVPFEQMSSTGKIFGPACLRTFHEGLLEKKRFGLRPSLLVYATGAGSFRLLLEIAVALPIAASFSTLSFNEDWKSSPFGRWEAVVTELFPCRVDCFQNLGSPGPRDLL